MLIKPLKIKRKLGLYQEAIADYTKAIGIDPKDFKSYSNRGLVKISLKDYQGVIDDITNAINTCSSKDPFCKDVFCQL